MFRTCVSVYGITFAVAVCNFASSALAENKQGKAAQERRDDERIREAQQALDRARKELQEAEKQLADAARRLIAAEDRRDDLARAVQEAKEQAEARLEEATGLRAALAAMRQAQAELDRIAAPILEALRKTPGYQAAKQAAEEARRRLPALRSDGTLSDEELRAALAEAAKAIQKPTELEQAAIQADSIARRAFERLAEATKKVAALRDKVRDRIEREADVRQALRRLEEANRALSQAEAAVASARREVLKHRQDVLQRQAKLAQAKEADRKNDQPDKKKKDKKGKK